MRLCNLLDLHRLSLPRPQNDGVSADRWPLAALRDRCPGSAGSGEEPPELPPFVPHDSELPDIHPGEQCAAWARQGAAIRQLPLELARQGYAAALLPPL